MGALGQREALDGNFPHQRSLDPSPTEKLGEAKSLPRAKQEFVFVYLFAYVPLPPGEAGSLPISKVVLGLTYSVSNSVSENERRGRCSGRDSKVKRTFLHL
jgi:hypothetical protein